MTQAKRSPVAANDGIQGVIRRCIRNLPLQQRLAVIKNSEVLAELRASDRRKALNIIRQRDKRGELDYPWLNGFLEVLRVLKSGENHF